MKASGQNMKTKPKGPIITQTQVVCLMSVVHVLWAINILPTQMLA